MVLGSRRPRDDAMNTTVIIIAVVAVAATFLLIRWSRRNEAAAPVETAPPRPAARTSGANQTLVEWLLARATEQTGVNLAGDALARDRIEQAAAQAMDELREGRSASVNLPFLAADASGPKHFAVRFKRNPDSTFELER